MGLMEGVEARSGAALEVITFVSNKGLTGAAGMVKEVIIAPISGTVVEHQSGIPVRISDEPEVGRSEENRRSNA
jgi:hypothetical protein